MTARTLAIAIGLLIVTHDVAAATTVEGTFGNDQETSSEVSGEAAVTRDGVHLDLTVGTPGSDGSEGSVETAGDPEPAPEGVWITVSDMVFVTDPPCIRTTSEFLEGVTQAEADVIRRTQENQFVAEYEAYISGGTEPPPPCPTPDGSPGIDPTPAQQYADDAESILPVANPTISGGYAITGLRSWVDLGRPSSFTDTRTLDLGPFTRTATFTATATATIDWGDGTLVDTPARGGGYHEGEPTADDITHTYRDSADSNTLTVIDTWEIVVTVPGLSDIRLTYAADPITMAFPIREVRSSRDR